MFRKIQAPFIRNSFCEFRSILINDLYIFLKFSQILSVGEMSSVNLFNTLKSHSTFTPVRILLLVTLFSKSSYLSNFSKNSE